MYVLIHILSMNELVMCPLYCVWHVESCECGDVRIAIAVRLSATT